MLGAFDCSTFDCKSCRRKNLPLAAFKFKRSMRFAKTCLICMNRKRKYYWMNKANSKQLAEQCN